MAVVGDDVAVCKSVVMNVERGVGGELASEEPFISQLVLSSPSPRQADRIRVG